MTNTNYKTIASKINFEGRVFINREHVNVIDKQKFDIINPATANVDLTVKVSRKAFNSGIWSKTSPEFRKDVLLKFVIL